MLKEKDFLNNNENIPISDEAIDSFLYELDEYDRQHHPGTAMGSMLAGLFMSQMEDGEESLEKLQEKVENNLTVHDLVDRHADNLSKVGLRLESPNKEGDFDKKETYVQGEMLINIYDKNKLISFLKNIDQKPSESQKKLLAVTARKLKQQFEYEYNLENAEDERLLNLLSGMGEIIEQYKRLGLQDVVTELLDYKEQLGSGFLREYVVAKKAGLFKPLGEGFNYSTFHKDSRPDMYEGSYWGKFFDAIEEIKKNKDANPLYVKAIEYAQKSLDYAEKDLGSLENYPEGYKGGLRTSMEKVRARLHALPKEIK